MRVKILTADPFEDSEPIVPYGGPGREGLAADIFAQREAGSAASTAMKS